jgi:hypothetical protein
MRKKCLQNFRASLTLLFFVLINGKVSYSQDYTGDNLYSILGKSIHSSDFKKFRDFWLLDRLLCNSYGGILVIENNKTELIDTIIVAGYNYKNMNHCTSKLPFGISLLDGYATIATKINSQAINLGDDKLYQIAGLSIWVRYNSDNHIQWLKFFKNNMSNIVVSPVLQSRTKEPAKTEFKKVDTDKTTKESSAKSTSSFKSAILSVFEAYRGLGLTSIKSSTRTKSNFWNYKYCYSTTLKIPGELFNMLYSYPFITSQLDFVSVIKESDSIDNAFKNAYSDAEARLTENFKSSEGWTSVCIPNKESKALSDIEYKNEKLGSIILDYSRNPNGKHILFLRFLFYSN